MKKGDILNMKKRMLGKSLEVSEIGLGCMTIGKDYTDEDKKEAIRIIRRAYELGVTMFDTAACYGGNYRNEILVGEAVKPFRDEIVIATKGGVLFEDGHMIIDSSPETIRKQVEGSLERLQTDHIDLYYTHRVDPNVPIEVVAQTMAELHEEGKILNWGISEPSMETLRKANAVFPVAAIESEYNMMWREPEETIFPTLEELGVGLVPYRPLAKGFLSDLNQGTYLDHAENTRFDSKYLSANMQLKEFVQKIAKEKNATAAQVALAWLLAQEPFIVPIPGTTNYNRMEENVKASEVTFTDEELNTINDLLSQIEIVGDRYAPGSEAANSVRK